MAHQTVKIVNFANDFAAWLYPLLDSQEIFRICVQPETSNLTVKK